MTNHRFICGERVVTLLQRCRALLLAPRAEAEAAGLPASDTEKSGNSFQALKDIEAIQEILPHR